MRARPMAFCTASPKDRAPRVFTICTLTVCACGTYSNGSEDVVTTSNVVSLQSATTMTPGNTVCSSTAASVSGRKRMSSSTVTTAATACETN